MTLKVLILGEGPTDVGCPDGLSGWSDGCILHLLRKINADIHFVPVSKADLKSTIPKKGAVKFEGHGKNIQKLIQLASLKKWQYDVIAYYGDTDKESGTKNTEVEARKASQKAYQQACDAFAHFEQNGVPIIPLRMLESWLLADGRAFLKAFDQQVSLPSSPEMLWGKKDDPNSDYPKHCMERVLAGIGQACNRETFCNIVECMDISVLEQNCPISAKPFLEKAKKYLVSLNFP